MTPTVRLGVVMAAISFARTVALLGTVVVVLAVAGALPGGVAGLLVTVLVLAAGTRAVLTVRYAVRRDRMEHPPLA